MRAVTKPEIGGGDCGVLTDARGPGEAIGEGKVAAKLALDAGIAAPEPATVAFNPPQEFE